MITQAPRGTRDIFGIDMFERQRLEKIIRNVCRCFGVAEIKTPIFEHTELFLRGVGESTDIVQKEMYSFYDKGNRSITLKPEGTAGVARAFIEQKMFSAVAPTKLFYIEPSFRYERPEAGRLRQFHQFGVEFFGSYSSFADAEAISLACHFIDEIGLDNVELRVNSLGGPACRRKFNTSLRDFIGSNIDGLCPVCRERFVNNPLRVLDCKNIICQEVIKSAPSVLDCLDVECATHFEELLRLLVGMGISFVVDPLIVRGLDYYTKTVFEFVSNDIGAQATVCGGGRYDSLIEECGGPATGAVGFAAGIERLLLSLHNQGSGEAFTPFKDVFIGSIGDEGRRLASSFVFKLRCLGVVAECDIVGRSVKAQLKYAGKAGARFSLVIGDDEIASNSVVVKNMIDGSRHNFKLSLLPTPAFVDFISGKGVFSYE